MSKLKRWLRTKAFERALKKPTPERISYASGNIPHIDCYNITIESKSGVGCELIVNSQLQQGVCGLQWDGAKYSLECSIANNTLEKCEVTITRYFRSAQTHYKSIADFWFGELTYVNERFLFKQKFEEFVFNASTRFRSDRMAVLKRLVDIHISDNSNSETIFPSEDEHTALDLFGKIYGNRIYGHPSFEPEFKRFKLILDSLLASGELTANNGRISLSGLSLKPSLILRKPNAATRIALT